MPMYWASGVDADGDPQLKGPYDDHNAADNDAYLADLRSVQVFSAQNPADARRKAARRGAGQSSMSGDGPMPSGAFSALPDEE